MEGKGRRARSWTPWLVMALVLSLAAHVWRSLPEGDEGPRIVSWHQEGDLHQPLLTIDFDRAVARPPFRDLPDGWVRLSPAASATLRPPRLVPLGSGSTT